VSVRPSTEMAKRRIMQTMPYDSSRTVSFLLLNNPICKAPECQDFCGASGQEHLEDLGKIQMGSPPMEVPNAGGVG